MLYPKQMKKSKMMDTIVGEEGEDIVVQVVKDNAANYRVAGQM